MVTIEVKENSKQAKAFIALAKTLSFVTFKESKTPYDPKFVAKIKTREKGINSKKLVKVNPDDVWGSIQ